MSKAQKQLYSLTEEQVARLSGHGTYPGANAAWGRAKSIRDAGGDPVIFYSEFNGFTVLDNHDTDQDVVRRIVSMEERAKPFPM